MAARAPSGECAPPVYCSRSWPGTGTMVAKVPMNAAMAPSQSPMNSTDPKRLVPEYERDGVGEQLGVCVALPQPAAASITFGETFTVGPLAVGVGPKTPQ